MICFLPPIFIVLKNLIHNLFVLIFFNILLFCEFQVLSFTEVFGMRFVAHIRAFDDWIDFWPYIWGCELFLYLEVSFRNLWPKLHCKHLICNFDHFFLFFGFTTICDTLLFVFIIFDPSNILLQVLFFHHYFIFFLLLLGLLRYFVVSLIYCMVFFGLIMEIISFGVWCIIFFNMVFFV